MVLCASARRKMRRRMAHPFALLAGAALKGGKPMCNPRRVMVNLIRTIEQSWHTLIEQTARVEGQVQELARIATDIPLNAEMGDLALEMLERILRGEFEGYDAWERDNDGNYRRDLG